MAEIGNKDEDPKEESAHLFVLVHGLWGSPNHMLTIERSLRELLQECSDEKIVTLKPSSFRFWKTYDGLKLNAERVIRDIFYEIEALKQKSNYKVVKISLVGYSLGGLISRYLIGVLNEIGFFEMVEPVFFTTFATPHVGIQFFNDNIFDHAANKMGQYLFGKSGREMFMTDHDKILMQMADPEGVYYKGLNKFRKHILLSNVKNDRTVAFNTSFITEYSPFDNWSNIKIKYLKGLQQSRIGKIYVKPKFVDLNRSIQMTRSEDEVFAGNIQEQTSIFRSNRIFRFLIIFLVSFFLLPFWIPLVLCSSLFASIYSMIKIRIIPAPKIKLHWQRVLDSVYGTSPVDVEDAKIGLQNRNERKSMSKQNYFKGDTSELTENTMEGLMYAEERFTGKSTEGAIQEEDGDEPNNTQNNTSNNEDNSGDNNEEMDDYDDSESDHEDYERTSILSKSNKKKVVEIDTKSNDQSIRQHYSTLTQWKNSRFPLFTKSCRLPINEEKQFVIDSLNKIDWIKIPVYIDAWNSHDGIVARRGPRTNPKGASTVCLWASILRNHMKGTDT